ncbi:hypothetical protein BURPS668_A0743 [Burkholderia pseudomallei 668]|nr:hypothetical protein BURPS668_A0743 [Burkholderia pseudomallei 668]
MRRRRDSPKPFESKRPAHLIQFVITSEMHLFNLLNHGEARLFQK